MTYKFSEKVSHLQASAIREILKFTSDPEVISFAAGNPCRVIREITEEDSMKYKPEILGDCEVIE